MRSIIAAVAVALGALVLCPAAHAQTLICGKAPAPPTIDAQPTDPCWQDAMVATDFSILSTGGEERAFRQTTIRAAWDDDALYLHAICLEPDPDSITADVTQRDGATWLEDALEVFLQPDTEKPEFFQFIVNAKGVLYDALSEDASFDANVEVRAEIGEQAWQVEMAIPWVELGLEAPAAGVEWGFNVCREHRPEEPKEWSTWAPLEKGRKQFGIPALFGRLRFADAPQPGRAAKLLLPESFVANPDFAKLTGEGPDKWRLGGHSTFAEIAPMSRHYGVRNDGDYGTVSQALDLPVKAGDIFTIYAVIRGSEGATAGIAAVQEMEDGRPDDLYPFWKMAVTDKFRLYSGRIVVDKGAKRLHSFRLYRANRKGSIEYAYAQMFRGLHGLYGIADAERCTRLEERGLGDPWPTPAAPAFKPLPGGPIKTLIFLGEFQRDAAELAQRLDIDYDLVYCPTYRGSGKVDTVVAFDAEGIMRRLARGDYDLIILAGRPSEQSVIDGILDSVRGGSGLVAVEPLAGGAAAKPEILEQLLDELPQEPLPAEGVGELLGALSPEAITQTSGGAQVLRSLAVREMAEGRIARLTWSEKVPGLIPFAPGHCDYCEYRWAALSKAALWATRRAPASRISAISCGPDLTIELTSPDAEALDVSVQWDGRFTSSGPVDFTTGPFKDGMARVTIAIPPTLRLARGPTVARVLLTDKHGQALDIAACLAPDSQPRLELTNVEAQQEARPGETIPVTVKYTSHVAAEQTITVELIDACDRVVSRDLLGFSGKGEHTREFKLAVRAPLSVYHRIVVCAIDGGDDGVLADRIERDLFVPSANANHLDDFALGAGYAAMHVRCPEYLQNHLVDFLKAQGIRACTVNEYMVKRGLFAFGGMAGAGMPHRDNEHARKRCFSDPEQVKAMAARVVNAIGKKRRWGFFGYNMDDEVHLHQSASVEVCNSPHCARAFRDWARDAYETIAAANAEWGTDYGSCNAIEVPLLADMKGEENPARWVDFRLFMERVWANAYAATHEAVREAYPDVHLSFTNPYKYNSLSGTDFSLWVPHEEILLRYFHRHVVDRNKSWTRAPMISWFGYRRDALQSGHFVWWFAFNGGVVPIWWDPVEPWAYHGKEGFTPWYMYGPLWRTTSRSEAVTSAARDLQAGIGKLLRAAEPAPAEALILHSQPSMHVLYAGPAMKIGRPTQEGYNRYRASDDALAECLKRHAFSYRYVLPEQLAEGNVGEAKLILLPSCVALPDEAIEALRGFVARGGKLLADIMPATHDEHGKPGAHSPLADLFAGGSAVCLGEHASSASVDALDAALAKLGVSPAITWRTADGALPRHTELYRYRLGAGEYLGIVRAATDDAAQEGPLTIELPEERFAYDCRTGKFLGALSELTLELPAGDAQFIALLPYRPGKLTAACSVEGMNLKVRARIEGVGEPTDHVFRVEITPPQEEQPAAHYCHNAPAQGGELELTIPIALNDPRGVWRVRVRDVATGMVGEGTVSNMPHFGEG